MFVTTASTFAAMSKRVERALAMTREVMNLYVVSVMNVYGINMNE